MKRKLLITLLMAFSANLYSQQAKIGKADKSYENFAYIDAIKTYERVAEKGYKSADMFKKLANSYYFNAELEKANKWYKELFALNEDVEPEYYYRYSQTLKAIGEYEKADKMLDIFNAKSDNDSRAKLYEENRDYLKVIEVNSGRFQVVDAGINSGSTDYGASLFGNKLIFTSSRNAEGPLSIQRWSNQAYTGLYEAVITDEGELLNPKRFAISIDTKFNESSPAFTKDGTTIYFTRNNFNNGKVQKDKTNAILLKLYKAKISKDGKFSDVTELPFSSNEYSTAHPVLSPDEKTMYFTSNMPGSLGQSDLYKVAVNSDGSFGVPVNLGNTINTEGKETFPFLSDDNELYFSSDGHPGLGGLDIFVSKLSNDGSFGEVLNVGRPINSPIDDFAFYINVKTRNGFFSSNREGGKGYDDIYKFKEIKKLPTEHLLAGLITNEITGEILPGVKLTVYDEKMNTIKEVYSTKDGYTFGGLKGGEKYYVRAELKDYRTIELPVMINNDGSKTELPIVMEKIVIPVKVGDDLAKAFKINIIYFDLSNADIRPDAAIDLAKIVDVMKENPTMKVDVRSHTDSRYLRKFNQALSDKRAKTTIAWMKRQGINANRLSGRGYGEMQPVNKCKDEVPCTEEEYQQNRRSEFIIKAL